MRSADRFSFKFYREQVELINQALRRNINNPIRLESENVEILEDISDHLTNALKEFDELLKEE